MVFPKQTHLIPLVTTSLLGMAWNMVKEYASEQSFWQNIPFEYLIAIMLAFWVGLIVQDLYNKESWLWENRRIINKLFDVVALHVKHIEETPERLSVVLLIKYIREIKNGIITITVTAQNIRNPLKPFVIHCEAKVNCPAHSNKRIIICNLRIPRSNQPAIHSLWGKEVGGIELKEGQKTIVDGSKNLVVIEVKSKCRIQRFEFIADFCSPCLSQDMPYVNLIRPDEIANVTR